MRALRREDIGNFKSVLDNSTSEATGEMKKTTQVILNSVKTNVKNNINDEVCKFDYNYNMFGKTCRIYSISNSNLIKQ